MDGDENRKYRASVVLMFDYEDDSIEQARKTGKDILRMVEEDLSGGLREVYARGIVNVVRVVQKAPGVGKPQKVLVVGRLPAEQIFTRMDLRRRSHKFTFDGVEYHSKLRSHRLRCFKKNPACVVCGIVGTEMRLERNWTHEPGNAHWNLYAFNGQGHAVLMTLDHRIPLSKGGPDHPDNFQTMCYRCNQVKKDDHLTVEEVRAKLKLGPRPAEVPIINLPVVSGLDDDTPDVHGMDVADEEGAH